MTEIPSNQHITYQLQFRKCGKTACSTCRKGQGHGPYWYAYWREGTRLRSGYIGKNNPKTHQQVLPDQKNKKATGKLPPTKFNSPTQAVTSAAM